MACKMYKKVFYFILFLIGLSSCEKDIKEIDEPYVLMLTEEGQQAWKDGDLSISYFKFSEIKEILSNRNTSLSDTLRRAYLVSLCHLGNIQERLGNKKEAFNLHLKCNKVASQYNRSDYKAISIDNICDIDVDYSDAKSVIENALNEIPKNEETEYFLDYLESKLAIINAELGFLEKAKQSLFELINKPIHNKKDSFSRFSQYEFNKSLGKVFSLEKKYDKALVFYTKALKFSRDESLLKAGANLKIANIYFYQGNYNKVDSVLKEVETLADEDIIIKKQSLELYAKLYEKTNQTNKRLDTYSALRSFDNKLNAEKNNFLGLISDKFKIDKFKAENELNQARIKYISGIAFLLLLLLSVFHFYKQVNNRKDILEFEVATQKLEALAANRYIDGQEERNIRFAEILHDNVGANLSALNMFLSTLRKDVPENKYNHLTKVLGTTIKNTRNLAHLLEPPALKNAGLISAIAEKAEEFNCDGLAIEVNSPVEFVALEDNISRSLYNAILEFMNNTMKYAEATKMKIDFATPNQKKLAIRVIDNGKGFDTSNIPQSKGRGLNSIKSRINYFEGTFDIQSSNKGTTINIIVPAKETLKQSA